MAETSRFWDGTAVGDATVAPYDAATEFSAVLSVLANSLATTNNGGVFRWASGKLAVTGIASPLSVELGQALVAGTWYYNSAALSVVVPTPAGATRIDRIVLRKSWVDQTVRVTRIAGVEGGGVPALTQVGGTTWDIPLAQASITVGGVITVTDEREYIPIQDGSITDAMLVTSGSGVVRKLSETVCNVDTASPISITGISGAYKNLLIKILARSTTAGISTGLDIQLNGDAGLNYKFEQWSELFGGGGSHAVTWADQANSDRIRVGNVPQATSPAGAYGYCEIDIPFYTDVNAQKLVLSKLLSRADAASMSAERHYGIWTSTSVINRIDVMLQSGNFLAGSRIIIYGFP